MTGQGRERGDADLGQTPSELELAPGRTYRIEFSKAGFQKVTFRRYLFGAVAIHQACKPC